MSEKTLTINHKAVIISYEIKKDSMADHLAQHLHDLRRNVAEFVDEGEVPEVLETLDAYALPFQSEYQSADTPRLPLNKATWLAHALFATGEVHLIQASDLGIPLERVTTALSHMGDPKSTDSDSVKNTRQYLMAEKGRLTEKRLAVASKLGGLSLKLQGHRDSLATITQTGRRTRAERKIDRMDAPYAHALGGLLNARYATLNTVQGEKPRDRQLAFNSGRGNYELAYSSASARGLGVRGAALRAEIATAAIRHEHQGRTFDFGRFAGVRAEHATSRIETTKWRLRSLKDLGYLMLHDRAALQHVRAARAYYSSNRLSRREAIVAHP